MTRADRPYTRHVHVVCPNCNREQQPEDRFCAACGAALRTTCPSCGAEQLVTAAFCSACGLALRDGARRGAAVAAGEERRVVTVLFADLAGSTALAERLDPEDVRVLQGELFDLVNGEVERHGGVTEKFVGDAVLAVFGIPLAHEDDPERALRAAIGVRDAFAGFAERVRDRFGLDVGIRIGVNTGDVVSARDAAARGELMVSGDAVNVAARLQQHAEPGAVLVGARTRSATAREVRYRRQAALSMKGKSAPVEAWVAEELLDDPVRRGLDGFGAPLVGRDAELAVLAALAGRVRRERAPQLVTLYGNAGVGKSRLVEEFVQQLPEARVLVGRCLPYGDGITYWPLAEIAKSHAGVLQTDGSVAAWGKLEAAVASVVAAEHVAEVVEAVAWTIGLSLPGATPAGIDSRGVESRLVGAWVRYVAALGRDRFTVLVVDDLHWASQPLLDLLARLVDGLEAAAVLVLCPARPELLERRPDWGAGKANATSMTLTPLPPEDSARLVSMLLAVDELPAEILERVLGRAEGNPFFLEETVRMLVEQGRLARRDGAWTAERLDEMPLPDSVHGVIAARLDLLEAPQRDTLRRCAVVGKVFWPAAVGVDDGVVSQLARHGLVAEAGESDVAGSRQFAFKHSLTRDVAYQALPRSERRVLHRRVGDWIQQVAPDRRVETAELAAYHFAEALGYGETDESLRQRAFGLLLEAGYGNLARAAISSAVPLLARALELARGDRERASASLALGRGELALAHYDRSLGFLADAETLAGEIGDRTLRADALGWKSRACWLLGRGDEALRATSDAIATLEGLPETPQLARALARRSQLEMLSGAPEAAEHAREAITVARRVGDAFAEVNARINLATAEANAGSSAWSGDELSQMMEDALAAGAADEAYRAIVNYLWSVHAYAPIAEVEGVVLRQLERLREFEAPEIFDRYIDVSLASLVLVPSGRWEEALAVAGQMTHISPAQVVRHEVLAGIALRRGDLATARSLVPELERAAVATGEAQRIVPMACVVAPFAALVDDGELLRRVAREVVERRGRRWESTFPATPVARALAAAGEHELLADLVALLEEAMDAGGGGHLRVTLPAATAYLALAEGDAERAVPQLRAAVAVEREAGATYRVACLERDLARAFEALGSEPQAREHLARAAAVLEPLGCVNPV